WELIAWKKSNFFAVFMLLKILAVYAVVFIPVMLGLFIFFTCRLKKVSFLFSPQGVASHKVGQWNRAIKE
ncbi:hypothetical protein, partial [Bartonella sp. MM73XJBT]|uniref:hypothetical protein n=1 Tax=Bartonella sp. MM73XJBT TaxID=3019095 RepID=UPI0038576B86